MRRVEIKGYVVYDETETWRIKDGDDVADRIADLLLNEDYPCEWSFEALSDTEVVDVEE